MSIFGSSVKKVSATEFKKMLTDLSIKLDQNKRNEIEKMFHSDLVSRAGVTVDEYQVGLDWFRNNPRKHLLSDEDLEYVEEVFAKYLG